MTAERITNQMVETAALAIQRVTSFGHYEATDAALAALEAIGLPALIERVEAAEGAHREGGPAIKTRPVVLDGTGESQYNFDPLERRAVSAEVQRDAILAQSDALAAKVVDAYDEGVGDADAAWVAATRKSLTGRATITNPYRAARTEGTEGA